MNTHAQQRQDAEAIKARMTCRDVLRHFQVEYGGSGIRCPLPGHEDHKPSFGLFDGDRAFKCHGCGCKGDAITLWHLMKGRSGASFSETFREMRRAAGIQDEKASAETSYATPNDAAKAIVRRLNRDSGQAYALVAEWPYQDAKGIEVGRVLRFEDPSTGRDGKVYRPIHRVGSGWRIGDPPGGFPLYRLPDLLKSSGARLYVTEGEKAADALRSIGLPATTSAHGAKSGGKADWTACSDRPVCIVPDNDDAGAIYSDAVTAKLLSLDPPAEVHVLNLPDLPPKGDAHDFIEARRAAGVAPEEIRQEIERLAGDAQLVPREDLKAVTNRINGQAGGRPRKKRASFAALARGYRRDRAQVGSVGTLWRYQGQWYRYDGRCYRQQTDEAVRADVMAWLQRKDEDEAKDKDEKEKRNQAAKERRRQEQAGGDEGKEGAQEDTGGGSMEQLPEQLATISVLANVMENLCSTSLCVLPSEPILPFWLTPGHPQASGWIAAGNWLINIRNLARRMNGETIPDSEVVRENTPALFSTFALAYDYDPVAVCPKWLKYLEDVQPDPVSREVLQMLYGLALIPDTAWNVAFFFFGEAGTGKSVGLDVLTALVGLANICCLPLANLDSRFSTWLLTERLLNMVDDMPTEAEDGGLRRVEGMFKTVCSGGMVPVERKHANRQQDKPAIARCIMATNSLPLFHDRSEAMWDRLRIIPFNVRVRGSDRQVRRLQDVIIAEELPGVLNWAIAGLAKLLLRTTFPEHADGLAIKNEHRRACDPCRVFIEENYERGVQGESVPAAEMYRRFRDWALHNGHASRSATTFHTAAARTLGVQKQRLRRNYKNEEVYDCIRMRSDVQ